MAQKLLKRRLDVELGESGCIEFPKREFEYSFESWNLGCKRYIAPTAQVLPERGLAKERAQAIG
jgi:hypothetical protein